MKNSDLQVSSWLLVSRPFLRRTFFLLLVFADLFLVGTTVLGALRFVQTEAQNDALAAAMTENLIGLSVQEQFTPPLPRVVSAVLVPSTKKTFSVLATISNPSRAWAAVSIGYTMRVGQFVLAQGTTTLLPGEEKYIVALDHTLPVSENEKSIVAVEFDHGDWIHATAERSLPRVELAVENPEYRVLSTDTPALSQAIATAKNLSVTAYPEVEVIAVLFRGQTTVAVAKVVLKNLAAHEERPVDLRLYGTYVVTNVLMKASVTKLPAS